jgi:hypothetical protein
MPFFFLYRKSRAPQLLPGGGPRRRGGGAASRCPWRDGRLAGRCQSAAAASSAARRRGHSSRLQRAAWASGRAAVVRGGWPHGRLPGRVDDAALHSTATVWYESTAAPRFGAASIRILTPGGAGESTVGRRAQLSGVEGGGAASIRTSPGGEGIGGRLTDSCSVLLSRAQASRNKALVGAREAMSTSTSVRQSCTKTALTPHPFPYFLTYHTHARSSAVAC